MSKNMDLLKPEFREKYEIALKNCKLRGVTMTPFFTGRTPWEQAKLYRQSRSWAQIARRIQFLQKEGAIWLARVLTEVGPQHGKWATNASPGASWHQWGYACDAAVTNTKSEFIWNGDHIGYKVYREESEKLGLENLDQIHDYCHVQFYRHEVTDMYTWAEIDRFMKEMYDGKR